MDGKWETYGPDQDYQLSLKPSDYFRRQCFVAADPGEDVVKYVIDQVGDDRVVWASDYPHHDCPFPEATSMFLALEGTSEEQTEDSLGQRGQAFRNRCPARISGARELGRSRSPGLAP